MNFHALNNQQLLRKLKKKIKKNVVLFGRGHFA